MFYHLPLHRHPLFSGRLNPSRTPIEVVQQGVRTPQRIAESAPRMLPPVPETYARSAFLARFLALRGSYRPVVEQAPIESIQMNNRSPEISPNRRENVDFPAPPDPMTAILFPIANLHLPPQPSDVLPLGWTTVSVTVKHCLREVVRKGSRTPRCRGLACVGQACSWTAHVHGARLPGLHQSPASVLPRPFSDANDYNFTRPPSDSTHTPKKCCILGLFKKG